MPISLAESKNNCTEDYDPAVIDEFRKESVILDTLIFDDVVNPTGGGDTFDYGYRRLNTEPTADTRAINSEYVAANVTTTKHSVSLAVLGGSFEIDRVLARFGPAASGAVTLNMQQKIKAARTKFQDEVINGDTAVDANSFDGLDKALTGSTTESFGGRDPGANEFLDWSDFDTDERSVFKALDVLDEYLGLLDGAPTLLLGNKQLLGRIRAIVRRSGLYTRDAVDGLLGPNGRPINRETYGGIFFADAGEKAGSNSLIIPTEDRQVDGVSAATTNLTDLYAYRVGLDGFHGVSTVGGQLVQSWLPDFSTAKAVKTGEVELGPVGVALKATKSAAVLRNIKVKA